MGMFDYDVKVLASGYVRSTISDRDSPDIRPTLIVGQGVCMYV